MNNDYENNPVSTPVILFGGGVGVNSSKILLDFYN
jgi:hypothetical protein